MGLVYQLPGPERRRSSYAAAKSSRSTGAWSPIDASVNELIRNSGPGVRARIRQLVRDFPYFARAVKVIADYTVGEAIRMQSRVRAASGELDAALCQQIEDGWRRFGDEADLAGRLHLDEMVYLAKMQEVECGEFLLVRTRSDKPGRYVPLALQMIEADWLTSYGASPASSAYAVDQGVEYQRQTGEIVAYHFEDPDSWGKPRRVPAADVIHGFETLRPGQLRGISPFVSGVLVTKDLQDVMDNEIDAGKMAAKWLAFVYSDDPLARQQLLTTEEDGQKIEELENGIIEYLRHGEKVELAVNPRPGTNFPPFVRLILSMLAVATGVPYELLSGDYQGLNWAVTRVIRNDFSHALRPVSARHIRKLCLPVFSSYLSAAVLAGRLPIKNYFTDPYRYQRSEWYPPGMEPVDAQRQVKADIDEMNSGVRSPQEVVGRRGRDLEEVVKEIAAADEIYRKHGVSRASVSTALANNPAALDEE